MGKKSAKNVTVKNLFQNCLKMILENCKPKNKGQKLKSLKYYLIKQNA